VERRSRAVPRPAGVAVSVSDFELKAECLQHRHVGAALAEALREALSKFRWFAVADEAWCGSPLDVADQDLPSPSPSDRRYAVSGSLFALGAQIRVAVRVSESRTGEIVWGGHFDQRSNADFALVDDLTQRMAAELDRAILLAETAKAGRKARGCLQAHDCIMRAIPGCTRMSRHFTIEWLRTKYPPLLSGSLDVKAFRRAGVPEN
jgi:adenylate cyclase